MYIPESLTKKDKKKQKKMILKSKKLYKEKKYYIREKLKSFKSKKSKYIERAKKMYHVKSIKPNKELSKKTGCNISTLKKIIKKGEGAYYSSGSRPNQTPRSWGLARLASAITSGKSSRIDFQEIKTGCHHKKKAFVLANKRIKN
jgi:hypothetical protein